MKLTDQPVVAEQTLHWPFAAKHKNCAECNREYKPPSAKAATDYEPPATKPVQTCVIVPQSHHEGHYINWCKTHHQPASLCMNNVFPVLEGGDEAELAACPCGGQPVPSYRDSTGNRFITCDRIIDGRRCSFNAWEVDWNTRTFQPAGSPSDADAILYDLLNAFSRFHSQMDRCSKEEAFDKCTQFPCQNAWRVVKCISDAMTTAQPTLFAQGRQPFGTPTTKLKQRARAVNNLLGFLKVTPLKLNKEDAMTLSALINAITTDVEQGEKEES